MLAMSTVLRREAPFKTIFGYATLFGEDGRAMHKSWGNSIEFDEAAERMGCDVMRWMYTSARPEDNILFGWHAADEARRELLVLWNVYAFFVTYAGARLADYDALGATRALRMFIDDLSTWYLRRSRDRMRASAEPADRDAAFATLHAALVTLARTMAPLLPFLSESMY